ncbi:hypothetical protein FGO68_gene5451 [Halteria grandinella]|uniref:Uncharacterized protein n=1 Tax=Halteria grandinella TaxID=5974 RepID=A0A8J8NS27_HALGN|nr:hypothetical protein FGO68_gene5451 [Halteria grandinella]
MQQQQIGKEEHLQKLNIKNPRSESKGENYSQCQLDNSKQEIVASITSIITNSAPFKDDLMRDLSQDRSDHQCMGFTNLSSLQSKSTSESHTKNIKNRKKGIRKSYCYCSRIKLQRDINWISGK